MKRKKNGEWLTIKYHGEWLSVMVSGQSNIT